ncbi:MAG: hypothetical protein BBJ60_02885 [Desulfobacterales bacterium S7086C20]|nr:MAG: hypothetical protein BBJ60_02885 [Desulfobacterales bacterium S7086C20]
MKKSLSRLFFVAVFLMMATEAWAVNGGVVKWSQPPDMEFGVNIQSTEVEPIVADDWKCRDPRPVTDVHFWGSYIGWEIDKPEPQLPPPGVAAFKIRIYKDVPVGPNDPYSHPGELLYEQKILTFKEEYVDSIPHRNETFEHKFYYSLDLPEPFEQKEGTIYWISIAAIMPDDSQYPWGWETSTRHWNDNACRYWLQSIYWGEIIPGMLPDWYPHRRVDMAFELTVPFEPPPPLEPIKWQQRPDMVRGVNIKSDPNEQATVADDCFCLDGSPVSDLHFWGSYPGWGEQNPEPPAMRPPGVEKFRIQIYSDAPAPAGTPQEFSRPDKLLYEVWVDKFAETYVDSIPLPWKVYEHKYRYDLDLPRIFWQKRGKTYWLNISAVPKNLEYAWGWESSMDRWNDFAVQGRYIDPDNRWWEIIKHPWTEDPIDMSFVLTTCKGPIKWLQLPDMANGFNIISRPPDSSTIPPAMVVADDWLCTNGKPITEVHFWGSYLNREGEHWEQYNSGPPALPPSPGVEGFKLSFHKDIPAGVDPKMPWSHPGTLIRDVWVNEFQERYWDSVPHTGPDGSIWWEHKFYYIVHLKEQPFLQEKGKVYWLDIGAKPREGSNWYWGWETSKDHWNDNAVRGDGNWWKELGHSPSDFEDLILGTTYNVGDSFTTSGTLISVKKFQWSNGDWTDAGHTTVENGGRAGGSGNEMNVNNVNLDFDLGLPVTGLSLLFGEYGGNLNIQINSVFKNFENFSEINGEIIDGVYVTVVNGFGNAMGSLHLTGLIQQFAIGGQELWIDDVKYGRVDMAFLLITPDDTPYCKSDFVRDGDVDKNDLATFAADYGRTDCYCTGDCEGDFNYDGDVDGSDLAGFAAEYSQENCPCALPVNSH